MKIRAIMVAATLAASAGTLALAGIPSDLSNHPLRGLDAASSLAFVENAGQWPDSIHFRAQAGPVTLWFSSCCVYYEFAAPPAPSDAQTGICGEASPTLVRARFAGADPEPTPEGAALLCRSNNFFLGNDPSRWRSCAASYAALVYRDLYPGIDLTYYGSDRCIEYDFTIRPGADPSAIRIAYDGVRSLAVDSDGNLVIETSLGRVTEHAPVVYQMIGAGRIPVPCSYTVDGHTFGFRLGDSYDRSVALVIDPVLGFSTYLGGSGSDEKATAVAVDSAGNVFVAGYTQSADFPHVNAWDSTAGGARDMFVTCISADRDLVYSTFIGGGDRDEAIAIDLDDSGRVWVAGYTYSSDFPVGGSVDMTFGGATDGTVFRLSADGGNIDFSTYLGGSGYDDASDIVVGDSGSAWIAGSTSSSDFPVRDGYDLTHNGGADAFVCQMQSESSSLLFCTFLGGTGEDYGSAVAVNDSGLIYLAGMAWSSNFPLENPIQPVSGGDRDAFLAILSRSGDNLNFSTYLGGASIDQLRSLAIGSDGSIHGLGRTFSAGFPTVRPYDATLGGGSDAFLIKLPRNCDSLVYSTFLGGTDTEEIGRLAVDSGGNAYVCGTTYSTNFPLANAYQSYIHGSSDAFIAVLDSLGAGLIFGTYFGGYSPEEATDLALGSHRSIHVVGATSSTSGFPILNPTQPVTGGGTDCFITSFIDPALDSPDDPRPGLPADFQISQNYPNPFNPVTTILYSVPARCMVTIEIFNVLGERVLTLVDEWKSAGSHEVEWSGDDESGRPVSTGMYLYRLRTDRGELTRKMLLIK